MRKTKVYCLAILLLTACAAGGEEGLKKFPGDYISEFNGRLRDAGVMGASYALFDKDSAIVSVGYGYQAPGDSVTTSSKFLTGSVTKVFTAVAVMQLVQSGQVSLDSSIQKYIPEFAIKQRFANSSPITVRSILTHHAGIPTDMYDGKFSRNKKNLSYIIDYLNSVYTTSPVGKIRSYSNLGYALLGILVERVSGVEYQEYIKTRIFDPLNMSGSGFYCEADSSYIIAKPYSINGKEGFELPLADTPAGAIYSSVADMVKFGSIFLNNGGPLLDSASMSAMLTVVNDNVALDLDDRASICFTLRNKAPELGSIYEHGGATLYHRCNFVFAPKAGVGAVIMSNSSNGVDEAWRLSEEFMSRYISEKGVTVVDSSNNMRNIEFSVSQGRSLEEFAGDYAAPGFSFYTKWIDNNLFCEIAGNSFWMVPFEERSYTPAKKVMGIMFKSKKMWFFLERISGEDVIVQAMPWGDLVITGSKYISTPVSPAWRERLGRYSIVSNDTTQLPMIENIELKERDGKLVLTHGFCEYGMPIPSPEFILLADSDSVAFTAGLGRGSGETIYFHQGSANKMSYMGLTLVKQE